MDSVYSLPSGFSDYDILDRQRFLDTDKDFTRNHGWRTFDLLKFFAPYSSFYLYQSVDEDGDIKLEDFADVVDTAIKDGVDILNVSAGRARPGCSGGACGFCRVAKSAFEEDITVVAAAGNSDPSGGKKPIHCPAFEDSVISVAGFEALCTYQPSLGPQEPGLQNPVKAPFANWAEQTTDIDYPPGTAKEAYCSCKDCARDGSCRSYREFQEWPLNPSPAGSKPDILSPVHYVINVTEVPFIHGASSYGAPIVSGIVAWALSLLLNHQRAARPFEIQRALIDGADQMNSPSADRLNAQKFLDHLL